MENREKVIRHLGERIRHPKCRTVFIIGAGASNEVASLPLGGDLINLLLSRWGCADSEIYKATLNKISSEYGFNKEDVKTVLFALNAIDSERVVDDVCRYLSVSKEIRSPFYTQVADAFFRREIDVILNFNFDILLDEALNDATRLRKYGRIISDAEVCENERDCLNYPLYLKPHGSADHRETLRFQRRDYYRIGENLTRLIGKVFSEYPVNFVIVGFRAKFYEFTNIVRKELHPDSEIFIVDKKEDVLDEQLLSFYHGGFVNIENNFLLSDFMRHLMAFVREP